jgi:hypothetical protein
MKEEAQCALDSSWRKSKAQLRSCQGSTVRTNNFSISTRNFNTERAMFNIRKSAAIALTSVVAVSTLMTASAQSTGKNLSSNFTLVNLQAGENSGTIQYVKDDGSQWRSAEPFTLNNLGDQLIKRQYDDGSLTAGSGSVVVSTAGPVGAVVQIQARSPQVPTFGAYVGVSEGAQEASVPLVLRNRTTASGTGNSQIIVQNASETAITAEIILVDGGTGSTTFTKQVPTLQAGQAYEYDLAEEAASNVPDNWFGSATVRASSGGQVAVVSNLFSGAHAMQTFNAFTASKTQWGVPLFASKLANSLSTPVAVQNTGDAPIPAGTVTMSCTKDPAAPGQQTLSFQNATAINPSASYFFNPVTDAAMPALWFGACTVNTGSFPTAVFVQLRTVDGDRAGAHEGIPLDSTATTAVIPLYAKRLTNGFAAAITILNLSTSQPANVTLSYKAGEGKGAECTTSFDKQIPAGGSLIQNMRINGNPNSVPQIADNCFGTLTITSDRPIHAFAQLDLLDELLEPDPGGDPFQAHNAFTIASGAN